MWPTSSVIFKLLFAGLSIMSPTTSVVFTLHSRTSFCMVGFSTTSSETSFRSSQARLSIPCASSDFSTSNEFDVSTGFVLQRQRIHQVFGLYVALLVALLTCQTIGLCNNLAPFLKEGV